MFGDQLAWLENDLQKASQRKEITWIIAGGHRFVDWLIEWFDF